MNTFWLKARERSGLTQAQVATTLGYTTPQLVSNWERGTCAPPRQALARLAKVYKLKVNDVVNHIISRQAQKLRKVLKGH